MKLRILGSGSRGNAALLWAGETLVLIDAGLPVRTLSERLLGSRIGHRAIDHVLVSHGHLDHARTAGIIAKRHGAVLHCAAKIHQHRSVARAPDKRDLRIGVETTLEAKNGGAGPRVATVRVPHDCDPTMAFRIEHEGRVLALLTDMGEPREDVASALAGAHVLVIESNHDVDMLRSGAYPAPLKDRVAGPGGHLSNDQMAIMLTRLAAPELHTVVLAHLSEKNNRPDLAETVARDALERLGRSDVRVLLATQDTPLDVLDV
ncbi:MAG: MBL fold metallo-hydrolase [Planctomycetota bacterium]